MRPATIFAGLLGGVLVTALLVPVMYLDVPRAYIDDWSSAPRALGLGFIVAAGALLVLTGMGGGAAWPERQARGGVLAGFTASMVALVVVLPGLGIAAHGELIALLESGRVGEVELKRAVVKSVVLTPWYQTLGAAGTLATGVLLGWIGGVVHDLWRGQPTRAAPTVRPSPVAWVGLATMPVMVPTLLGAILSTETLVFQDLGATPTWLGQAQLTAPLGLGFAIAGACLFMVGRDAVLVWRSGHRVRALVWLLGATLLVLLPLASVPIYWRILILPGSLAGMLLTGLLFVGGLIAGAMTDDVLEDQPRVFQDVVGEGVLAGALVAVQTAVHGLSAALVVGPVAAPFRAMLVEGITSIESQSLSDAVQQAYAYHLALPAVGVGFTVAYLTIGLPIWLVSRIMNR